MHTTSPKVAIEPRFTRGDVSVLRISGELDVAGVDEASVAMSLTELAGARTIILDLCDLDLIDSRGLRFLLDHCERLRRDNRRLVVAAAPGSLVRRLLELTLLTERITVVASPGEALSGCGEPG